jgi:hypothetical protein
LTALMLRMACDDGAVVYVNGRQVYRRNLAENIEVGPTTFANVLVEDDSTKRFFQYPVASFLPRPGTNVVAVELHQHSAGLNDAWMDLELIPNLPLTLPEVRITSPTNGAVVPLAPVRLQVETSDRDGFVYLMRYSINSWPAAESDTEPFDYLWTPPKAGRYRAVAEAVDNSGRRRESAPTYFQVGSVGPPRVTRGPYLQSGSPTGMVVRWRTDWPEASVVRYGAGPQDLDHAASGVPGLDHEVAITGLAPDTTYYYTVGTEGGPTEGGAGDDFHFRTSPLSTRPVRIWAIGDSGKTNFAPKAVRNAYLDYGGRTDVWLMLGDNAYEDGTDDQYQVAVFETYPMLLRNTVLWPALPRAVRRARVRHRALLLV